MLGVKLFTKRIASQGYAYWEYLETNQFCYVCSF